MKNGKSRTKTGKVTLSDVAKAVNVSPMTVSRAIREPERVKAEIREKILTAIHQLGYVPNIAASSLASSHSKTIVLVTNSFNNTMFKAISPFLASKFKKLGYRTRFESFDEDEEPNYSTNLLVSINPEAVILFGIKNHSLCWDRITPLDIPIFMLGCIQPPEMGQINIDFDIHQAFPKIISHLINQGHQKIGLLTAKNSNYFSDVEVISHWNNAMLQANKSPQQIFNHYGSSETKSIYGTLESILKTWPDVDALICSEPLLAYATHQYCLKNGIHIPQQCAIVCLFDDLNPYFHDIECTRLFFNYEQISNIIYKQLVDFFNHHKKPNISLAFQPQFIIGRTS